MGHRLKLCSGPDAIKKFQKAGWAIARQVGSHVMLVKSDYPYTLSVPQHKELGFGLLKKLLHQARITTEEFNAL